MLRREDLHDYQNRAIEYVKTKKSCGLFLDMGCGKSCITLTTIADLLDDFAVMRVLIIGPLRVANTVWHKEATNWEHLQHLDIGICTGSAKERNAVLQRKHDITVINRENVQWLVENTRGWPWDMVVIDESSSFKSHKARRFKALRSRLKWVTHMVLLTGTPSPNGLMDLWSQLFLIDRGQRLGKTITGFRQRFFVPSGFQGYGWAAREDSADKIKDIISDVCLSMSAEDYLDLPDRIDLVESVDLPHSVERQYKDLEKEFVLSLDDIDIETPTAATMAGKLLQICNGAVYDEDGEWHEMHNAKLDALKAIVEDNAGENILVAYNFKSDLERLTKAFPKAVVLDKEGKAVDDWNQGKIKMLLAHPASAGHGLNLQKGGSLIVWFGLNWSLELYQQFNARLHRQGQTRPVRIVHIICSDTIDQRVMNALGDKAKTQQELLDHIKAEIKE